MASSPDPSEIGFVSLKTEEEVLSDVHLDGDLNPDPLSHTVVSRFAFRLPRGLRPDSRGDPLPVGASHLESQMDDDLDDVRRPSTVQREVIMIEHRMATVLRDVGTQVWRGALYLCDFILANAEEFRQKTVLELGAGVGLSGILPAYVGCPRIFCTDGLEEALRLCTANISHNEILLRDRSQNIRVRHLNWLKPTLDASQEADDSLWNWLKEDEIELQKGFVVVAADVIYSDELTDGFLETLLWLYRTFQEPFTLWLSLEKRINFSLEELQICSPPYRHFLQLLEENHCHFEYAKITTSFQQYFDYERVPELELWKISLRPH